MALTPRNFASIARFLAGEAEGPPPEITGRSSAWFLFLSRTAPVWVPAALVLLGAGAAAAWQSGGVLGYAGLLLLVLFGL